METRRSLWRINPITKWKDLRSSSWQSAEAHTSCCFSTCQKQPLNISHPEAFTAELHILIWIISFVWQSWSDSTTESTRHFLMWGSQRVYPIPLCCADELTCAACPFPAKWHVCAHSAQKGHCGKAMEDNSTRLMPVKIYWLVVPYLQFKKSSEITCPSQLSRLTRGGDWHSCCCVAFTHAVWTAKGYQQR